MKGKTEMNISELSEAAEVTPRTVRYYIGVGLLPRPSTAGGGAKYGAEHLRHLRAIARMKEERLTLSEIREALADGLEPEWRTIELEPGRLELRLHREASAEVRARFDGILGRDEELRARRKERP